MRTAFAALFLVLAMPASAQGTMYRCEGPEGRLSFQQMPCAPGQPGHELQAREVPVTTMGDNILLRAQLNRYERESDHVVHLVRWAGHKHRTRPCVEPGHWHRRHAAPRACER